MKIHPWFLFSFVTRFWPLILLFIGLVIMGKFDQIVFFVGPLFYLIQLVVGVMVSVLFALHIVFRQTIDPMLESNPVNASGNSDFVVAWATMPKAEQLKWAIIIICVLTLSFSIIAASIAK